MNKYIRNIVVILMIVVLFMLLFHFRFKVEFGFGQLFVIIAGIYGIYLNLDALMKERKKKCENQTYS